MIPEDVAISQSPDAAERSIEVSYQLTAADYRSATIELSRQSVPMVAIGAYAMSASALALLNGDLSGVFFLAFGASLVTGLYCVPFTWWAIRKRADLLLSRQDLTIDASGIRVTTALTTAHQAWPTFRRVRELTDVFTLDYGTGTNALLPKRAVDPETAERFRDVIRKFTRLETPGRWTNVGRGVGLGALVAVLNVVVVSIVAGAGS